MPDFDTVAASAAQVAPGAIELRRDLHRHPEVGWTERRTTYEIARHLKALGVVPRVRPDGTGLVAEIGEGEPIVGFRADIDALPLHEANDVPYRSQNEGVMHACGHDVHTAIGVGIASVLSTMDDLGGTVRFIFQPAEELLPGGAVTLADEGVHRDLSAIVAYHVDPSLEPGRLGLRVGAITSASDRMVVRLHGPGGHTSRPHQTVDLVHVAARVVIDLPARLRAAIDPRHAVVPVFGSIAGGRAANVIPTDVELVGTIRSLDTDLWRRLPKLTERLCADIVTPLGATFELDYQQGSPPVVNDADVVAAIGDVATGLLGSDAVHETHQSLGSEDFSWYLESVPGAMIRLGVARADRTVDLHSASFDIDESAIETGIAVGAAALLRLLDRPR